MLSEENQENDPAKIKWELCLSYAAITLVGPVYMK